jgi:hypothetical protein
MRLRAKVNVKVNFFRDRITMPPLRKTSAALTAGLTPLPRRCMQRLYSASGEGGWGELCHRITITLLVIRTSPALSVQRYAPERQVETGMTMLCVPGPRS